MIHVNIIFNKLDKALIVFIINLYLLLLQLMQCNRIIIIIII